MSHSLTGRIFSFLVSVTRHLRFTVQTHFSCFSLWGWFLPSVDTLLCPMASVWAGPVERPGRMWEGGRAFTPVLCLGAPLAQAVCSTHLSPSRFTQHPHTRAPSGGDISSDVSLRFLHFSLWLPYTFVISAFVNKSLTGEDIYRIMLHLTTNDVLE